MAGEEGGGRRPPRVLGDEGNRLDDDEGVLVLSGLWACGFF
jgi:hypothetical protein